MRKKLRTHRFEYGAVLIVLSIPLLMADVFKWSEIICSIAVFITFMHAQVADRMQEKMAQQAVPDVECYRWSNRYFITKEFLWIAFFLMIGSYAALTGAILFFIYPFWRKLYRKHNPL